MIAAERQHDWLQKIIHQVNPKAVKEIPDWFQKNQQNAQRIVMQLPKINRKQEAWRYSRVDSLFKQNFKVLDDVDCESLTINKWLLNEFDSFRMVFVNGRYAAELSDVAELANNVQVISLRAAIKSDPRQVIEWFSQLGEKNDQLFTALNTALLNDGVVIDVADGVELDKPIEIIYLNTSRVAQFDVMEAAADWDGVMAQTRNIVFLRKDAKATLVERFIGVDQGQYFHNNLSDIVLYEGAALKHYRMQDESRAAYHLSNLNIALQKNSRYAGTHIAFGATWSKTDINIGFKGAGAECILNGLYVVGEGQLTDFHLDVQHSVPACISRQRFKGILYGKGRAVFDGHILVEKDAQHSDAQLTNDNLMLVRDAEVDTKPQLEIYANDVKCGHGTTVGQIDQQQIFYMRSRGLSEIAANKLLCLGFAADVIDSIDEEVLSDYISEKLVATLSDASFNSR